MTAALRPPVAATSDDVVIGHLDVAWYAPEGLDDERFARLVAQLLDGPLEDALADVGVASTEVVCLRSVEVPPHRVSWHQTDAEVVARWSGSIGRAVATAVATGSSDDTLVRYASVAHAVTDLVVRVVAGDLRRSWAWAQLGLWSDPPSDGAVRAAANDIAVAFEVLAEHADLAPAVVRELARRGLLHSFAAGDRPERLVELAGSAWKTLAGAPWEIPAQAEIRLGDLLQAERIVARSAVAAAAGIEIRSGGELRALHWAWALLVVLEVEPSIAVLGSRSTPVVAATARLLAAVAQPGRADVSPSADESDGDPVVDGAQTGPDGPEGHFVDLSIDHGPGIAKPGIDVGGPAGGAPAAPTEEVEPVDSHTATSRWGGLLFLLHLLDGSDLVARLADRSDLGGAGLRSVLHAMGAVLVARAVPDAAAPDGDDPAILAFAGLGPTSDVPDGPEAGPTAAALRTFVDREADDLIDRLRARLADADLGAAAEPALLLGVLRRRAVVTADPGWIGVALDLDDVVTDLRRVGLDLDPGFVPWLGVVVRFTYG